MNPTPVTPERVASSLEVKYQEHDLDDVLRYFADGFKAKPDTKIVRYEFFIDTYRRTVVFKLYIECKTK